MTVMKVVYKTKHWKIVKANYLYEQAYYIHCDFCDFCLDHVPEMKTGWHFAQCTDKKNKIPAKLLKIFKMLRYLNKIL